MNMFRKKELDFSRFEGIINDAEASGVQPTRDATVLAVLTAKSLGVKVTARVGGEAEFASKTTGLPRTIGIRFRWCADKLMPRLPSSKDRFKWFV